jgi:hypothetical protein
MKSNVRELFLYHVRDQYLFPFSRLVYPYIFWRLAAYEKFMGLIGEAYSFQGSQATIVQPILSPPWHRSLSEFKFIDLKTAVSLALFAGCFFSYFRTVFLSFSPHGPHGGQHIPGDR